MELSLKRVLTSMQYTSNFLLQGAQWSFTRANEISCIKKTI